jgi:hypothetical protein
MIEKAADPEVIEVLSEVNLGRVARRMLRYPEIVEALKQSIGQGMISPLPTVATMDADKLRLIFLLAHFGLEDRLRAIEERDR